MAAMRNRRGTTDLRGRRQFCKPTDESQGRQKDSDERVSEARIRPVCGLKIDNSSTGAYHLGLPFFGFGRKGSMRSRTTAGSTTDRRWHIIDANGQVLGRVATRAARLLQGKHKPTWTPYLDTGDHVIVVNAATVKLTGRKEEQKLYRQHSGYEGGLREERAKVVRQKRPIRMVEEAVRGMRPKTKLGDAMYRKLKVYAAGEHPHGAQKPTILEVA
jgi:large subunit ribosomal protein L13